MEALSKGRDVNKSADDLPPAGTKAVAASLPQTGFLTAATVKRRYAISNSTLHKWRAEGHFPAPIRIGPRAVRYRVEDLRAFEANLKDAGK